MTLRPILRADTKGDVSGLLERLPDASVFVRRIKFTPDSPAARQAALSSANSWSGGGGGGVGGGGGAAAPKAAPPPSSSWRTVAEAAAGRVSRAAASVRAYITG